MWRVSSKLFLRALGVLLIAASCQLATAQDDPTNGETDPVKLFERAQDAHAKGDYKKAIELYESAIKLKPEFPEAEFQRAMALLMTNRKPEALEGFNRSIALRPGWALAYSKFGTFLGSYGNDPATAEPILRKAIELDPKDVFAMTVLAEIRTQAGDTSEGLKLIRNATTQPTAKSSTWRKRSFIEAAAGDRVAALASLDKALEIDPRDLGARHQRARLRLDADNRDGALSDLRELEQAGHASELPGTFELAQLYARAGKPADALRLLDALTEKDRRAPEVIALRAEIADDGGLGEEARAALEQLLNRDPQNASLLARLGNAYRLVDPLKSQDYYYRALKIEPGNADYATGYASALIQSRKFAEAATVLQRVIAAQPDNYVAHANFALALYEMKRFAESVPEYEWLIGKKPEIAATYFFLGSAHDNLGQYPQALEAYQQFLSRADPSKNKLEIEKINLRMPTLRVQIQRGEGVKDAKKNKPE
jgi:tetratricopeptide (TPR) repeat protein